MLLAFGIYPLLYSVWLSFQERSRVTRQYEFVGLKQWQRGLHRRADVARAGR